MTDRPAVYITIRGPWGVWWVAWWAALFGWFWVAFFYVPRDVWVIGNMWLFAAWAPTELVGHIRLRVAEPDGLEVVKTCSQVPQLVRQLAAANAKWYQGYKGLALGMTLTQAWAAASVYGAHWLWWGGILMGLLLTSALWTHYWSRSEVG